MGSVCSVELDWLKMRRGFTLIEVLVVVAVVAIMLGGAVIGVVANMNSANTAVGVRRAFQLAKQARKMALLKQKSSMIHIEEVYDGQEFIGMRFEVSSPNDQKDDTPDATNLRNMSGELINDPALKEQIEDGATGDDEMDNESEEEGPNEDPLSLIIDDPKESDAEAKGLVLPREHSFRGVRVKVVFGGEEDETDEPVSVFSTVRAVKNSVWAAKKKRDAEFEAQKNAEEAMTPANAPQEIVYEPNGCCTPYELHIYKDGADELDATIIRVDKFGSVRILDDEDNRSSRRRRRR